MDCTLKIIAGPETGQEFLCAGGETYMGRSQRCLIHLSSGAISFEHALITRVGDDYFVENLSANGTLLNHQRLLTRTRLRLKDQIQVGDTVARVERLPVAASAGANRRWLLVGFVGLLLAALVIVILDPFSTRSPQGQLQVYRAFQQYAQEQVVQNGMPRDVPGLLADAWRLDTAGDRAGAAKTWVNVQVMLDRWDQQQGRIDTVHSTDGLEQLKNGEKKTLSDDEMRVALKQWVIQRERGG